MLTADAQTSPGFPATQPLRERRNFSDAPRASRYHMAKQKPAPALYQLRRNGSLCSSFARGATKHCLAKNWPVETSDSSPLGQTVSEMRNERGGGSTPVSCAFDKRRQHGIPIPSGFPTRSVLPGSPIEFCLSTHAVGDLRV